MTREQSRVRGMRETDTATPNTPRGLRRWLERLARLEPRELSRELTDALATLNQREAPPRRRLRLLELLRPSSERALKYFGGRLHSQALPLPAPARTSHDLDLALLRELASGYETVLFDPRVQSSRRTLARAAERALVCHGERMLRAAQTYTSLDAGFWQRIHTIYRRAEQAGVHARRVRDPALGSAPRRRQSASDAYKQLLLFALAGTQCFRRGEARRLHRALESWSRLAQLGAADHESANEYPRFAVDLDRSEPPQLLEQIGDGRSVRALEVGELVHRIEQLRIDQPPEDNPLPAEDELSAGALARLVDGLQPDRYRRSKRARRGSVVDAETTLNVIHSRLVVEVEPALEHEPPAAEWTLAPVEAPGIRHNDGIRPGVNWNEIPSGRDHSAGYEAAREAEAQTLRADTGTLSQPRWLLQDVSGSGFRLMWDGAGSCRLAVGELVALRLARKSGERDRWCVGVVRRMQFLDERRFEVGVQALSRNALAARVRPEPANPNTMRYRDSEPSAPALLLPADRARGRETTLLIPAHMHRRNDILELDLHDRMVRVALGELMEDSGAFCQHALETPPDRGRHATSDAHFAASMKSRAADPGSRPQATDLSG